MLTRIEALWLTGFSFKKLNGETARFQMETEAAGTVTRCEQNDRRADAVGGTSVSAG